MAIVNSIHVLSASFLLLYLILCLIIFSIIYRAQPVPYMDEIFHIPQAQKYCEGKFYEWDSKITTPPGLYIVSVGILGPLSQALSRYICDPWHLRFINVMFALGNFYLLLSITVKLHHNYSPTKLVLTALNMSIFPVLYFFTFLYYTDVGSTFFVLLAYLNHLYGQNTMAAIFGAFSLFFRQTNIVWVFFMACEKVADILSSQVRFEKKKSLVVSKGSVVYLLQMFQTLLAMPLYQRKLFFSIISETIRTCASYICVGLAFILFLFWNGGVVVGDRSAHQMVPHLSQLCYFLGFLLGFANPFLLTWPKVTKSFNYLWENPVQVIAWMLSIAIILRYLSYEHPYLLADNRHITFYIWRKFIGRHFFRYCLIPLYFYSGWAFFNIFQFKNALWKFGLVLSIVLAVLPQPLLEFRYFILPYLFIRFHIPVGSTVQLLTELVINITINSAMIYLFIQHPFKWEGNEEIQRFIW